MVDTAFAGFTVPPRAYVLPDDVLLGQSAGGGGVNYAGNAFLAKNAAGNYGAGTTSPADKLDVYGTLRLTRPSASTVYGQIWSEADTLFLRSVYPGGGSARIEFQVSNGATTQTVGVFDGVGNLLVNAAAPFYSGHVINKNTAAGNAILTLASATTGMQSAVFLAVSSQGWNAADAALWLGKQANGRSLNAGGSINGSGADPAEYWRRSLSCGTILAGEICGINSANELTTDWADAVRYGVKSGLINQPFIVGNDVYAKVYEETAGPAPVAPEAIVPAPIEPVAPAPFTTPEPVQGEGEDTVAFAVRLVQWSQLAQEAATAMTAYMAAATAYPAQLAEWTALNAAYQADLTAFEAADAVWRAGLEAERQRWDRISIGGQVYIRTEQACGSGDYVIPVQDGDGIGFAFVPADAVTFEQYRRKVGVVLTTTGEWPLIEVIRS